MREQSVSGIKILFYNFLCFWRGAIPALGEEHAAGGKTLIKLGALYTSPHIVL